MDHDELSLMVSERYSMDLTDPRIANLLNIGFMRVAKAHHELESEGRKSGAVGLCKACRLFKLHKCV